MKTFVAKYNVPESGMEEMIKMMEAEKVPFNEKEYKISEHSIKLRTKALVARNLYDNEAFYEVINDLNPALKRAVEVLKDGTFDKQKLAHNDFK
jgi:carboxyl-terminal processing protease